MIDGSRVTFVIPFRMGSSASRLVSLGLCIRHLSQNVADFDCVLVEAASESTLMRYALPPGVQLVYIRDTSVFNLAKLRNIGIKLSTRPFSWVLDGDVLLDPNYDTSSLCADTVTTPYEKVIHVSQADAGLHHAELFTWATANLKSLKVHKTDAGCTALTCVIPKNLIPKIGLFDETFQGWGFEDGEYAHRIMRLGAKRKIEELDAVHIDHELPHGATGKNSQGLLVGGESGPIVEKNYKNYRTVIGLSEQQLRERHGLCSEPRAQFRHIYHEPQFGQDWFSYRGFYKSLVDQLPNGSTVVEVGSWKGKSTAFLAVEVLISGKAVSVHAVDTWLGSDDEAQRADSDVKAGALYERFLDNVKTLRSVITPVRMTSLDASKRYADSSLDVVYIDASHKYQDVKNDILAWLPKVKPGGILAGHDIAMHDVQRAVAETIKPPGIGYSSQENIWVYVKPK